MWISKWRTAPTDVWVVNFSTGHVSGKWWYPKVHGLYYIWLCIYIYIYNYIYIYPTHGCLMYVLFRWLLESRYEDKLHRLWRFDSANWLSQIPELKIKPCWLLKADTYTSHEVRSWVFLGGLAVEIPPRRFAVLGLTWHPNSWPATALGVGKNALGFSTSCSNGGDYISNAWMTHFTIPVLLLGCLFHEFFRTPCDCYHSQPCAAPWIKHVTQRWTPRNDLAGMCPPFLVLFEGKPGRGNLEHSNLRGSFLEFSFNMFQIFLQT